jgi:polyketide cyclase/dehydrase/lipid transport protein
MERVPSCCAAAADREAASQLKEHAMARMEATVTIMRPVEEVFGFFLALDENAPKVDPSAGSVVKSLEGPAGSGTTFRFRQHTLGKVRETTTRFTGVEPNRKIEFEAEIGPMRPRCDLIFEQAGGGTRVTFRGDSNPVGPLRWLNPVFNRKGQQVWGQGLARVKTVLEASAT